ncbi:MAG: ABC transporter permease [Bacteroidales bacterium]|nr:ABC transporter permease [Bacteroidales bacterium]
MLKSYLLVTFRNLVKNRVFTLINIIGLGIALAVCIVAFFNHMFNYEFDRTHENFDSIYRVTCFRDMQGREQEYGIIPATLGLEAKKDIPGITRSARLARSGSPVKEGLDIFPSQISYVDPEFLDIFTFPVVLGDKKSIENQGNVLVSSKMAAILFGSEFPIGKSISVVDGKNREHTFTVGAVFADLPENSSFRIDILTHFDNFLSMWDVKDNDWKFWMACFFIQVNDKSLLPSINQALKQYLPVQNKAREDFKVNRYSLVPLDDVGESSRNIWSSGLFPSLHPAALVAPPIMALFILLIACFNFANTSISTFSKRLKEIGLRKTFGGQRRQLVTQFMLETFIICILALFVGLLVAEFLVPAYSSLWAYMSIEMTLTKYTFFYVFLLLLLLVTGFVAGVYPAIYVSSFSPVYVLKGASPFRGSGKLSSVLLALQFSISVMAIVLGIVFAKNAGFQKTLDLGYDRDKTIIVPVPQEYFSSFRNEIISNPKVISAEGTSHHIGYGSYRRPVKDADKRLEVDVMDIGHSYAQTMGLRLVDGRFFDELREAADINNGSIIVNQKLVNDFDWRDPVGHTITLYDTIKLTVIGVVEDFYINGVWQAVEPAMLRIITSERFGLIAVRANPEDLAAVLEDISLKWKNLKTNSVFGGRLQEDLMQEEKDINGSIMKVNIFLAVVATLLSLIGMYNLVSLDIIKRTKEMGIRKIQGAPVPVIMYLVSRKFIIVLVIASIAGSVGGYYLSIMLMDSIWDYFVDISMGMILAAVSVMFVATSITVIFKIIRAAMKNPVVSLRYE